MGAKKVCADAGDDIMSCVTRDLGEYEGCTSGLAPSRSAILRRDVSAASSIWMQDLVDFTAPSGMVKYTEKLEAAAVEVCSSKMAK
jgi:hypothetical protein